jgi:chitin disaccharide deacetylase
MKYLIVNGDDFGLSRGINRGIVEAHRRGILTSTSLVVDMPWSEEAAWLSRALPDLGIGLHVNITNEGRESAIDLTDADNCRAELHRQFGRFEELMGRPPTHLDSHHNVHRDARLLPHFLDLARRYGVPLREHSPVRYVSTFYGRWGGETHPEQISVDGLLRLVESDVRDGFTELGCHPGYADPNVQSSYAIEREIELRTLCDPIVRTVLAAQQIQLVSFRALGNLLTNLNLGTQS